MKQSIRNFNETDRKKKSERIHLEENPDDMSREVIVQLEGTIKESLKE